MSHELKTPLANIREGTELLLDGSVGQLDIQQQEVTGILRDNGVKLQKLIENLLTFSAWQTHTAALELSEFELKPMVFSVLSQHRLVFSNKKIKLQLAISAINVLADEGKLKLVLENLLSNAIKFTPSGGTIHVGAGMEGHDLVIDVSDDGPGVHPDDGDRIFEAFYQGRRPQGGPVGGTGIGLSVVAECVQAHGGSVDLVRGEATGRPFQGAAAAAARRGQTLEGGQCVAPPPSLLLRRAGRLQPRGSAPQTANGRRPRAGGAAQPCRASATASAVYLETLRSLIEGDAVVQADVFRNVCGRRRRGADDDEPPHARRSRSRPRRIRRATPRKRSGC